MIATRRLSGKLVHVWHARDPMADNRFRIVRDSRGRYRRQWLNSVSRWTSIPERYAEAFMRAWLAKPPTLVEVRR